MSTDRISRDAVLAALSVHIGADNGVSVRDLAAQIVGGPMFVTDGDERAVRHRIEELRAEGHHICAHPTTGYHMAATDEELERTCEYLYSRAIGSLQKVAAMRRASLPDLRGQLRLPAEPREEP